MAAPGAGGDDPVSMGASVTPCGGSLGRCGTLRPVHARGAPLGSADPGGAWAPTTRRSWLADHPRVEAPRRYPIPASWLERDLPSRDDREGQLHLDYPVLSMRCGVLYFVSGPSAPSSDTE